MIEQALRTFCEARHRTLIVIAGTFVVGLVMVLPLVDVIRAGRDEKKALTAELDSAKTVAAGLKGFEGRVSEKLAELKVFEDRTVNDETMVTLRGKLVDLAKETRCSVRRLNVGTVATRPWKPGESPIGPAEVKQGESASPFQLEWRPVSISLSGSSGDLRSLLDRIGALNMLMHGKNFVMYPSGPNRQSLTLDLELWYFTLARRS
jgi:hypothetical protein